MLPILIYPSYLPGSGTRFFDMFLEMSGIRLIPYFSGRSAMVFGLKALGMDRMDEIMVPPYLGHCVLSALSRVSFPAMSVSERTRAILVYHQFGFPQRIDEIEDFARKRNLIIFNDCANTIFTEVGGQNIVAWGDVAIVSLAKLFPCGMGGGLWMKDKEVHKKLPKVDDLDRKLAEESFEYFISIQSGEYKERTDIHIQALYGYLPDIQSMAPNAWTSLPDLADDIHADIERRKRIYALSVEKFEDLVPICEGDVVPFAVPIRGDRTKLEEISRKIQGTMGYSLPVLHFDYHRNMLAPDYRPSLVVGCHDRWDIGSVEEILTVIEREL